MMRKRLAFFGVLVLVFALALPSRAFAWDICGDGVWWRGNTSDGMFGVCVHADNEFEAAAYCFYGYDPDSMPSDVRSKLSDPNYGGRFYEYAQTFTHMENLTQYPDWLPAYVGVGNILGNGLISGITSTGFYTSEVESSLYFGAKEDFSRVLAGEDLSGGGAVDEGSFEGVYLNAFSSNSSVNYSNAAYNASFSDGVVSLTGGEMLFSPYTLNNHYVSQVCLYVSVPVIRYVNELISDGYIVSLAVSPSGRNTAECLVFYARDLSISLRRFDDNSTSYVFYGTDIKYIKSHSYGSVLHSSDGFFAVSYSVPDGATVNSYPSGHSPSYMSPVINAPIDLPSIDPGGDWPQVTPTPTPDPPEVPTPTAPTNTPDPEPTAPTVVWPTAPIVVNPPEVTVEVTPSGIDYTELLTLINDNLNSIDAYTQAINSCLNSLRADIVSGFDDVVTSLRNVYQYLTHLNDVLEVHCKHIRDSIDQNVYELELYLKSLFEWLPRQLDYDAQFTYDDSAVTTLLYRILNKIPGGSTATPTTYMPNPQADEPGFFDWLLDLWHRFLIDLVSVLPDELGGLVDAFSQLTHYFPISIPWDIYALLALFEHEPVTPVFDLPWGYGGGEGEIQNVRVDLSCWDSVMAFIRPVFVVGFCIKLALITKDLLSNFDINKGGI